MQFDIQSRNYEPSKRVRSTIEERSQKLLKFADIDRLRFTLTGEHVQNICEIHVHVLGKDFHSKALEKDFDVIYFVGTFAGHAEGEDQGGGMESMSGMGGMGSGGDPHGGMNMSTMGGSSHNTVEMTEVASVDKADFAVAEIFAGSADLGGKTVKVRGQVVKFTPNIMGTNWIHVQDGTGDLTVTSSAVVAVGDIVLVEGPLTVNKDFGAGYKYDAIIEGAKVTKE